MGANDQSDVVDVVLKQHEEAKSGLTDVLNAAGDARAEKFRALAPVLAAHEEAEEAVIYPAIRKLGDESAAVADARTKEEGAAKETLTKLKDMDPASSEFTDMFQAFRADVLAHAEKEEAEVLPLLRSSFSDDERRAMGAAFAASQDKVPSK